MSATRIRRLNDKGLRRMAEFLDSQTTGAPQAYGEAQSLLTDRETSEGISGVAEVDPRRTFARRFDLAAYLHERVPRLGLPDPTRDAGLWAWLALLWFEQLAPIERGQRKVGERARWIPETDSSRRHYRHLVLGAYTLYHANEDKPDRAMVLLSNPPHTPGEIVGQLAASQGLMQCRSFVGAATRLYFDGERGTFRRGTAGRGAGSAERLRTVMGQFDRTFDLQSLTEDRLIELLPKEFSKFKKT